jgi:hypothetical protein
MLISLMTREVLELARGVVDIPSPCEKIVAYIRLGLLSQNGLGPESPFPWFHTVGLERQDKWSCRAAS